MFFLVVHNTLIFKWFKNNLLNNCKNTNGPIIYQNKVHVYPSFWYGIKVDRLYFCIKCLSMWVLRFSSGGDQCVFCLLKQYTFFRLPFLIILKPTLFRFPHTTSKQSQQHNSNTRDNSNTHTHIHARTHAHTGLIFSLRQ